MAQVYNPKDCVTTINGNYAVTGYSTSMITGTKDNPLMSVQEGAQGDAVVNVSNSKLGTITITLQAVSPSCAVLTDLAKKREFFSIWCSNKTLGERMGGTEAFVENYPQKDNNETVGDRVYTIKVLDYDVSDENV